MLTIGDTWAIPYVITSKCNLPFTAVYQPFSIDQYNGITAFEFQGSDPKGQTTQSWFVKGLNPALVNLAIPLMMQQSKTSSCS